MLLRARRLADAWEEVLLLLPPQRRLQLLRPRGAAQSGR